MYWSPVSESSVDAPLPDPLVTCSKKSTFGTLRIVVTICSSATWPAGGGGQLTLRTARPPCHCGADASTQMVVTPGTQSKSVLTQPGPQPRGKKLTVVPSG